MTQVAQNPPQWDDKGYAIAFGCQGRFGNQFDYLLGAAISGRMRWALTILCRFLTGALI